MNADQPPVNQTMDRRLSVHEAAVALGITPEAVRGRIQRGTLPKEKADDGTVYVRLTADQMRSTADESADAVGAEGERVAELRERIKHLMQIIATRDEEIRRRDAILLTMAQRLPELEPASEPRESPETASEDDGRVEGREGEGGSSRRPWWQWMFGR
jgi:hypothetical protein